MQTELRFGELRAEEGRVLSGIAVRYGDTATLPWGQERIRSGAFVDGRLGDVLLNRQHDRARPLARTGGGGMELDDGPEALRMRAVLPETRDADDVLALVRAGVMRGLSIEFVSREERMAGKVRIIERAKLLALAVVDQPAYPAALVQAREAALSALSGPPARKVWW